jgi:hypothetical protein
MKVPVGFFTDEELSLGGGEPEENDFFNILKTLDVNPRDSEEEELSFESFRKGEKVYKQHERLLNQLMSADFRGFPPLGNVRHRTIFIVKGKVGYVKQRIIEASLTHLLLHSRKIVPDEEQSWVEIHRDLLDLDDPLFSDQFSFSLGEEPTEEDILPHTSQMVRGGFHFSRRDVGPVDRLINLSTVLEDDSPPAPIPSSIGGTVTETVTED